MTSLLGAGASAGMLLVIMLGGGVALWLGVPLVWLYIGSQVQAATSSVGNAIAVMLIGATTSVVALAAALGWLNRKHAELREARGLSKQDNTALEAVMIVSALVAVVGFTFWFLVLEGPGPSLAPTN